MFEYLRKRITMKLLLVEDDKELNRTLTYQLEKEGFAVDSCLDGEEACYYMEEGLYDLVLLDRMLPKLDGIGVLTEMRKKGDMTPVIMLTALGALTDKITGLDCGADDYLVKPFDFEELTARIRSIGRRPRQMESTEKLTFADISYEPEEARLTGPEDTCSLSRREGALMETFLRNIGQSLSRPILLYRVWGPDTDVEEGNLDNYIYFLRRRLKAVGSRVQLKTVRSIGYRMEDC